MARVKRELKFIKVKAVEAVGKLSNDESITSLQRQILWFQKEALELDKILEGQKKELQKKSTEHKSHKSDNQFIRSQVKDAMRHNKLLEVALVKTTK